jgi:hypothetical protein
MKSLIDRRGKEKGRLIYSHLGDHRERCRAMWAQVDAKERRQLRSPQSPVLAVCDMLCSSPSTHPGLHDRQSFGGWPMRLPRFSISAAMALIVVLAVDFSLVRQIVAGAGISVFACLGVFFMANVLAYQTLSLLVRQRPLRPFQKGFFCGGAISVVGFVAWLWAYPDLARSVIHDWTKEFASFWLTTGYRYVNKAYSTIVFRRGLDIFIASCLALPQLFSAIFTGWLCRMLVSRRHSRLQ